MFDEHHRCEQQRQADRDAREKAFASVNSRERVDNSPSDTRPDILPTSGDDEFSFTELGRASQKATRQRQERMEQARRGKVRRVCAVVAGAVAGAIADAILFGANSDELSLRIVATLFLGIFCGLLGYAVALSFLGGILAAHGPAKASLFDTALYVSLLAAEQPATWAAAGMERSTLHGYACAVGCEMVATFLVWRFERARPKGDA